MSSSDSARGALVRRAGSTRSQPVGLAGAPIKIGYAYNLLQRLATWHYAYPQGIKILAVARMNRPNDTHFRKRRALQLAEQTLKHELRDFVVARDEWMHPAAEARILETMRRLQRSLSPNLKEHFYDFASTPSVLTSVHAGAGPPTAPCHTRCKTVSPRCEDEPGCVWEKARPRGRCVPRGSSRP